MVNLAGRNKKRRIRKKLFLDEFAVLGFSISFDLDIHEEDEFFEFLDGFLHHVETNRLIFGGGGGHNKFEGFVCPDDRYRSATETNRNSFNEWLSGQGKVTNIEIGQLVDATYGI